MKTICKFFELKEGCLNIWDCVYSRRAECVCVSAWLREIRHRRFDVGISETYLNASSPRAALSPDQAEFSSAAWTSSYSLVFVSSFSLVTFTSSDCVTRRSRPRVTSPLAAKPGGTASPRSRSAAGTSRPRLCLHLHQTGVTCDQEHVSESTFHQTRVIIGGERTSGTLSFPALEFAADQMILTEENLLGFLRCSSWQF